MKMMIIALLLLLLLVGCGRNNGQFDEDLLVQYTIDENMYEDIRKQAPDTNTLPVTVSQQERPITMADLRPAQSLNLTVEELLYDFDYMFQVMEDTFPFFGVVERRFGLDLHVLAEETREIIINYPYSLQAFAYEIGINLEDMPALDEHVFWSILLGDFFQHFRPFAHAATLDFSSPLRMGTFDSLNSRTFYHSQEALIQNLVAENPKLLPFYFRFDPSYHRPLEDYEYYESSVSSQIITTAIIEDGSIAYLQIGHLLNNTNLFVHQLINFYEEIQEYEHLIIDMRDSGGGHAFTSPALIMYPLWYDRDNAPDMTMYAFFTDFDLARSLSQRLQVMQAYVREPDRVLSLSEILEIDELPYLNEDDKPFLPYGFRINVNVNNINLNSSRTTSTLNIPRIPFAGEIWLLTSNQNYSASAIFANMAKGTGFATLVGEQVAGGLTATTPYSFTLPNTGIVVVWDRDYLTDQYGRSLLEYLPTPHYFNKEGMDALETTLSIISERRGY